MEMETVTSTLFTISQKLDVLVISIVVLVVLGVVDLFRRLTMSRR